MDSSTSSLAEVNPVCLAVHMSRIAGVRLAVVGWQQDLCLPQLLLPLLLQSGSAVLQSDGIIMLGLK